MGIRGFIRNTVEAIRRFFSGPEAESDLTDDASPIQYIEETLSAEEIIVEETLSAEEIIVEETSAAEEIIVEETAIEDIITDEFAIDEFATDEFAVEETVIATIQAPETIETVVRLPVVEEEALEEAVVEEVALEEVAVEAFVVEAETPTDNEQIDEPEDIAIPDEAFATQVSYPMTLDLADLTDVDSVAVPVDIADDLTDSHLVVDELDDICSDDAMLDDDLSHDDTFVEPLSPDLKMPQRKPRRKAATEAFELNILNYPVDITNELDDSFIEQRPILDTLPNKPRHKRAEEVVVLDIFNYSVDTADEAETYLNEVIHYDDLSEEERESSPSEAINLFGDPDGICVQSGGEKMTLVSALESLLFVAERPVDVAHLAKILGQSTKEITLGLQTLDQFYTVTQRGLRIQDHEDKFQLVTAPFAASIVEDFLSFNLSTKLSGPALEALAVVAYRQPVTRAQVEAVRGVDCASVLRSLIQLGLIEESGRLETLGRPILYSITDLFMQHFGLLKMSELPPLEIKEEDLLMSTTELSEL